MPRVSAWGLGAHVWEWLGVHGSYLGLRAWGLSLGLRVQGWGSGLGILESRVSVADLEDHGQC